ncbi:MAG: CPBP family intramembrane metalloprotease [Deltaproteobacteria bacterium]|nr:CPBP family intramembrane metalloprotease [Deltaproteobacteria bacterium]
MQEQDQRKGLAARLNLGVPWDLARTFLVAAVLIVLYRFGCGESFYNAQVKPLLGVGKGFLFGLGHNPWRGVSTFVVLLVVPLLFARLVERRPVSEVGFAVGDWQKGIKWGGIFLAVMIPVIIAVSFTKTFSGKYPLNAAAGRSIEALFVYELSMLLYFFGWEFYFRGYFLFSLERHIGSAAVFVQMVPFAVLHGNKPFAEAMAAIFTGTVLGYFALRTRTFLYCAIVHFLCSLSMDLAALVQKGKLPGF